MEKDFLKVIISATGLPEHLIKKELQDLATQKKLDVKKINLEQLRELMVSYLQKELLKARSFFKPR